jgi:cytochrome o ubiquinol oxidase subunit IV
MKYSPQSTHKASVTSYTIGFLLSIGLTLAAYIVVETHTRSGHVAYSHDGITIAIMALALVQLVVQVTWFLHLGSESKPKWNVVSFLFMVLTVLIIGIGSIWIMNNLNYNMMHEQEIDAHMHEQSQKGY